MSLSAARHWLHDAWILFLAPWLPSRLPWRWAWRCYRGMARWSSLYPEPTLAAANIAPDYVPIDDITAFKRDVRTIWLLDAADYQRSRRRPVDWWPDDIDVQGQWPDGPFVVLSFHYGTGLWVFRDLRRHGHEAVMMFARFDREDFRQHPLRYRYGVARLAEVERISGQAVAFRPGVRLRLQQALAAGKAVLGLLDTPPRVAPRDQRPVHWLGRAASLPAGLLKLARESKVPIVPCWVEIDFVSGRRKLVIDAPLVASTDDTALAQLAARLDRLIRVQPAAWLFWNEWPVWQRDAAALHAEAAAFLNKPDASR